MKSIAELQGKMDKIMQAKEDLELRVEQMELNEHSQNLQMESEKQGKEDFKQRLAEA